MYEFHGWIRLAESPSEIEGEFFGEKFDALKSYVDKIEWLSGRAEILLQNGVYTLIVNAVPNRRGSESVDLNSLVEFVLRGFKGAYGVIYEYDEQNEVLEGRGVFSVKVIKRGSCETRLDPFLSPAIPTVEDPCD